MILAMSSHTRPLHPITDFIGHHRIFSLSAASSTPTSFPKRNTAMSHIEECVYE